MLKRYYVVECYERNKATNEYNKIHIRIHRGSREGLALYWKDWNDTQDTERFDEIVCVCPTMEDAIEILKGRYRK